VKKWKMSSSDFYHLLTVEQNFRCQLTGRELRPQNTSVIHKIPRSKGGRHAPSNVQLVRSEVAALARIHTVEEIYQLCQEILDYRDAEREDRSDGVMPSKWDWRFLLFKVTTLNRQAASKQARAIRQAPATWGERSAQEISRLNREYVKIKTP